MEHTGSAPSSEKVNIVNVGDVDEKSNVISEEWIAFIKPFPEALFLISAKGFVLAVNPAVSRMIGLPGQKLLGKSVTELVMDSPEKVTRYLQICMGTGTMIPGSLTWYKNDGQTIVCGCKGAAVKPRPNNESHIILLRCQPRAEGNNFSMLNRQLANIRKEYHQVVALKNDLEQQVAERTASLTKSEARFSGIVEMAMDAIISIDEKKEIILFNKGAEQIFGYSMEAVIGKSLEYLLPAGAVVYLQSQIAGLATNDTTGFKINEHKALHGRRKNGEKFPVEASFSIIDVNSEKIFTIIMRDITERKRAEEKLNSYATNLEESNRELQDFAYVASHDLQEPLRKIVVFGDRLKAKSGDTFSDQGRDYLERMQSAARRMQTLINDLLSFSRVASKGKQWVSVDLSKIAREVLSDLEIRIEELGARVELSELPTLDADALQMRQIFQNLISNALKFQKKGETPVVTIVSKFLDNGETSGLSTTEKLCQITFSDNGIGFEEKYCERIFDIFQRLHARNEYKGTGIGLAVCRKIVKRHGGSIIAKSKPGEGATFVVTLPLRQKSEKE